MRKAGLLAAAVLLLLGVLSVTVFGESDREQEIADGLSSAAEVAGGEAEEMFAGNDVEQLADSLLTLLTPEQMLERLLGISADLLPDILKTFLVLSGLVIVCAICKMICGSVGTAELSDGFGFLSSAAILAAILLTQSGYMDMVADFFDRLGALMGAMIPICASVLAMGGNVSCATVGTAALYAMLAATQKICAVSVLPVCCTMEMAAICSGLGDGGALDGLVGAIKKIYNFIIGALMTVFVFSLGSQTLIASAADTVAARGGKLIAGTVIPGVGGAIGDTLRTLAGSVGYVKSVVGVGGVVLIASLTVPIIISLMLSRLAMLVVAELAKMLGCKSESRMIGEMASIYGFLVGAVSICAIAFTVAISIFLKCSVAIE